MFLQFYSTINPIIESNQLGEEEGKQMPIFLLIRLALLSYFFSSKAAGRDLSKTKRRKSVIKSEQSNQETLL